MADDRHKGLSGLPAIANSVQTVEMFVLGQGLRHLDL